MSRRYQFGALFVSKWEWLKLICLSLLISVAMTTALAIAAIYLGPPLRWPLSCPTYCSRCRQSIEAG